MKCYLVAYSTLIIWVILGLGGVSLLMSCDSKVLRSMAVGFAMLMGWWGNGIFNAILFTPPPPEVEVVVHECACQHTKK